MPVELEIDTAQLNAAMGRFGRRARNIQMGPVAAIMTTFIDDVFQAQGAVGGKNKWDPLAASTIKRHPRRSGGTILQDTGLMANVQSRVGSDTATVRSPAPYAAAHAKGSSRLPKRDPFDVDQRGMMREVEFYVLEELARG